MTRRTFLAGSLAAASAQRARPNLILYLADDHGWDLAGCYGNPVIQTPNLDALAAQGLRFTRAFAGSPTCSPSRAILFTGLHSPRNGLMGNHTRCKPGVRSIAQYRKELGDRVVLANKIHVKPVEVFDFEYVQATLPAVPGRQRRYRTEGLDTVAVDRLLADHATSTWVDIAGGKPSPDLDGRSFQDVLLGRKAEFRREIYAGRHPGEPSGGVRHLDPQSGNRSGGPPADRCHRTPSGRGTV